MEDFTSDVSQKRGWLQGKKVKCYVDMTIHQNHQYNTDNIKWMILERYNTLNHTNILEQH